MKAHPALALFVGALIVRLTVLVWTATTGRFPEFWEYEYIARHLLDGRGFVYDGHMGGDYHAYVEPLYPFLIAAVYAVTGRSALALGIVQCVLSALLAPVVYALGRRAFSPAAATLAAVLLTLHPALALYATKLHPLVLDSLLIALVVLAMARLMDAPRPRAALALGVALGACTLTRPTILAAIPAVLAWVASRGAGARALRLWLVALVVAAGVTAPWIVRNYVVLHAFVLTRTNTAFVFWLGNQPGAPGGAGDPSDPTGMRSLFDVASLELRQRVLEAPDELAKNRVFRDAALAYVRQEPLAFLGRSLRKLSYFWWFAPYEGRRYPGWEITLYKGLRAILLAAAVGGLVAALRRRLHARPDALAVLVLVATTISLVQAMFYIDGRHRLAVEPLLLVIAGAGMAALVRHGPREV
jgi:4-amino-4-deoxy-L-arabinose transferase-like glycosyltransferase